MVTPVTETPASETNPRDPAASEATPSAISLNLGRGRRSSSASTAGASRERPLRGLTVAEEFYRAETGGWLRAKAASRTSSQRVVSGGCSGARRR